MSGNWNEYNLNILTRIHWRASLVKIQMLTPERATMQYRAVASLSRRLGQSYHIAGNYRYKLNYTVTKLSCDTISSQVCLIQMLFID
jgi:hypothetical protein